MTNGPVGDVKKTRYLFLYGQTRIHVDDVQGLGTYMELEVCLKDEETLEYGTEVAHKIMEQLQISKDSLVTGAYMVDLFAILTMTNFVVFRTHFWSNSQLVY